MKSQNLKWTLMGHCLSTYLIPMRSFMVLMRSFMVLMQCPNGHTLCSDCKIRVHNCCPTCCLELGNIRCLALEKVAESLELPCRYQSLGCHDIFRYCSKLKHEQHCQFCPYNCPYAGSECSITCDIPTLVTHLKDDHNVDMHDGCTFNHRYVKANPHKVENVTWMLTVSLYMHHWLKYTEFEFIILILLFVFTKNMFIILIRVAVWL